MQNQKLSLFQKLLEFIKRVQFRRVGSQNDGLIHVRKYYLFRNNEIANNSLIRKLSTKLIDKILENRSIRSGCFSSLCIFCYSFQEYSNLDTPDV